MAQESDDENDPNHKWLLRFRFFFEKGWVSDAYLAYPDTNRSTYSDTCLTTTPLPASKLLIQPDNFAVFQVHVKVDGFARLRTNLLNWSRYTTFTQSSYFCSLILSVWQVRLLLHYLACLSAHFEISFFILRVRVLILSTMPRLSYLNVKHG